MRLNFRHIFIATGLAVVFSCNQFEEGIIEQEQPEVEKVEMTFRAVISDEADTKTILDGQLGDGARKVLWMPEDSIGIIAETNGMTSEFDYFSNTETEASEVAEFNGEAALAKNYFAVYPTTGSGFASIPGGERNHYYLIVDLPAVQKYVPHSFGHEASPMVAKAGYRETLDFQNVCGLLALNLKGSETIKSITFRGLDSNGNPMYVSGDFLVDMSYTDAPYLIAGPDGPITPDAMETNKAVTLECDEPVQLSETEATQFYFALPPGMYGGFTLIITTADGKIMIKEATKPITIKRSNIKITADLKYVETVSIDLSEAGTANSYIVPGSGLYSFDATTIGNGDFGLIGNANFHTNDTKITPATAELLWTTNEDAITNLSYDQSTGRISFMYNGNKGNALVAAKDAEGTILWSWHLWMTDQPQEHRYINNSNSYIMLDRNLGALRADKGSTRAEFFESMGMTYQWGRKDPFRLTGTDWDGWGKPFNTRNMQFTTLESIQMPEDYSTGYSDWNGDGMMDLWSTEGKTIYDPCPAGYRVPDPSAFTVFSTTGGDADRMSKINYYGSYDEGFNFIYDGSNYAWYPATYYFTYWGDLNFSTNICHLWTAEEYHNFRFYFNDDYASYLYFTNWSELVNAFSVRCMKDEATNNLIVSINNATNQTATSATASGKISAYGNLSVTAAGFVVGSRPDVTLQTGQTYTSENKTGDITAELTGLTSLTRYYVRAFATTSQGTTYSNAVSFITPNTEGIVDLSVGGTANSYIVSPVYSTYTINAVKGNSEESVGAMASAEILWETYNTSEAVVQNSVVASVVAEGNKVKFTIPENGRPGNALIAAKDANGTILWSWHIWVADFDPVATQQTYPSKAVMMDRNIGALNVIKGDVGNVGLMFQWGRKDPFTGRYVYGGSAYARTYPEDVIVSEYSDGRDTKEYAIQHPTSIIDNCSWNYNEGDLWDASKTIYDPCPAGWRVPDSNVWDGEVAMEGHEYYIVYKESSALYPTTGYIDGGSIINHHLGCYWTTTNLAEFYYAWGGNCLSDAGNPKENAAAIRCMKDIKEYTGDNQDFEKNEDDYEW